MHPVTFENRSYELVRASDVGRDGIGLELWDVTNGDRDGPILEVFYFDGSSRMTLSAYSEDLPLPMVEWFISKAHELLPPLTEDSGGADAASRPTA